MSQSFVVPVLIIVGYLSVFASVVIYFFSAVLYFSKVHNIKNDLENDVFSLFQGNGLRAFKNYIQLKKAQANEKITTIVDGSLNLYYKNYRLDIVTKNFEEIIDNFEMIHILPGRFQKLLNVFKYTFNRKFRATMEFEVQQPEELGKMVLLTGKNAENFDYPIHVLKKRREKDENITLDDVIKELVRTNENGAENIENPPTKETDKSQVVNKETEETQSVAQESEKITNTVEFKTKKTEGNPALDSKTIYKEDFDMLKADEELIDEKQRVYSKGEDASDTLIRMVEKEKTAIIGVTKNYALKAKSFLDRRKINQEVSKLLLLLENDPDNADLQKEIEAITSGAEPINGNKTKLAELTKIAHC